MNNSKSPTAITQNSKFKTQNSILLADLVGGVSKVKQCGLKAQFLHSPGPLGSAACLSKNALGI